MDKLSVILDKLSNVGVVLPDMVAIKFWLFARFTKDIIKNAIICFGGVFFVIHLYKASPSEGFKQVRKAVLFLTCAMSVYSIVEIGSLYGVPGAADIIAKISPCIMDVESSHGWWPPVVWMGQLRSLCAEPSFFGIVATFTVPILFSFILEGKNLVIILIYTFFVLMIFLTKARTATVLFLGEMLLLVLFTSTFMRKYWRRSLIILLLSGLAFVLNIKGVDVVYQKVAIALSSPIVITNNESEVKLESDVKPEATSVPPAELPTAVANNDMLNTSETKTNQSEATVLPIEQPVANKIVEETNKYVENNISSVVGNSRSNIARKACVYAQIMVGLKHPIFGVGHGLGSAYINNEIPEWSYSNDEVRNWSRYMYNQGVLKSGFPPLNNFAPILVSSGFIGLLLYSFPIGYVVYKVLKRKILKDNVPAICLFISFLGLFAAMFSSNEIMCFYIAMGLLLCYVENDVHVK